MYIWKLQRNGEVDYYENAGFVIAAETEYEARHIAEANAAAEGGWNWLVEAFSTCDAIGTADEGTKPGVILVDNAGA